jgi:hypothetical protein
MRTRSRRVFGQPRGPAHSRGRPSQGRRSLTGARRRRTCRRTRYCRTPPRPARHHHADRAVAAVPPRAEVSKPKLSAELKSGRHFARAAASQEAPCRPRDLGLGGKPQPSARSTLICAASLAVRLWPTLLCRHNKPCIALATLLRLQHRFGCPALIRSRHATYYT